MSWYCHWYSAFCIKGILNFTQTSHRPGYPYHWMFSKVWSHTVRISLNSPLRDVHCAGHMGGYGLHLLYVYLPELSLHTLSWYHQVGTKQVLGFQVCRFIFVKIICTSIWLFVPTYGQLHRLYIRSQLSAYGRYQSPSFLRSPDN
jgi:hypothetical protein